MAYRLTLYPVQAMSQVVHRVAYPTLSQLASTPVSARAFYLRSLQGVTLISFPALVGLGVVAESLVPLVLGEQWTGLIPVVEILAWVGLLQVITATVGTIYPAFGETRLMLRLGALNFVVVMAAFLIGVAFGIEGVALAYLGANTLMFLIQARMAWPLLGLPLSTGLAAIFPSLAASLLMGVLVTSVARATSGQDFSGFPTLLLQVSAGVLSYPVIVWLLFRERLSDLRSALRRT
jgi:PST family polysaccharide transporter